MAGYWIRHRFLATVIFCVVLASITSFLFATPYINQKAGNYNSQSVYKYSDIGFIAPEPSYDQINELPGTNGIEKVFPFYLTKTQVNANGKSRTSTILLSDQFQNVDSTMYNSKRLIDTASTESDNYVFADWQFCQDMSVKAGDTVSFLLAGTNVEFRIAAVYETNSVYDGGALLVKINNDQKNAIQKAAQNNGYSGMYVIASDYNACKAYLTTEYRPLGRLKSRDQFSDEEQYKIHYDAIMASGYANEITDFTVKASGSEKKTNINSILLGSGLAALLLIVFNVVMANRGCEGGYFKKHCIPKGQNVKSYYVLSFVFEQLIFCGLYVALVVFYNNLAKIFVPKTLGIYEIAIIPAVTFLAGIICLVINSSRVAIKK